MTTLTMATDDDLAGIDGTGVVVRLLHRLLPPVAEED